MITQSVLGYASVLVSCKHHYRKVRCECQCVCACVCVGTKSTWKSISKTLAGGFSFIIAVTSQSVSVGGVTLDGPGPHDQSFSTLMLRELVHSLFFSFSLNACTHH